MRYLIILYEISDQFHKFNYLFQPYITILASNFRGKPTISLVTILHESIEKSTLKKTEGANGRSQVVPITIGVTLGLFEGRVIPLSNPVLKGIERIGFSRSLHGTKHKVTVLADSLCGPFGLVQASLSLYANGT